MEGAEVYGLGSWADIADHIGGFRSKEEVRDHYISTYVDTPNFPLPAKADPNDLSLLDEVPRDVFQARKKRRIEERKEAAKNAPPAAPKQKPTSSVPSCHEVQGYMPGRLEFETEFANEAEEAVMHMQFDPGEGINPRTGEMEPEMELKMVVMNIYNSKLTARALRKRAIFEHNLLEYRKNTTIDKKRTKEEKELYNKAKPFSRMTNHEDFKNFATDLEYEHNLRSAIGQLQEWRHMSLTDFKSGEKYETEKHQRAARPAPTGSFDRLAGVRPSKPPPPVETPSGTLALTAPELPERLKATLRPPADGGRTNKNGSVQTNGVAKPGYVVTSIPGITPLKFTGDNSTDLHLLGPEEKELCSVLRITPKAYLVIKDGVLKEAIKSGGGLKRKSAKELCKVCYDPPADYYTSSLTSYG